MLGEALKAGIPMEKSPSAATEVPLPLHEPTKDFTTNETKQPKVVAAPVDGSQKLSTKTTVASPHVPTTSVSAQVSSTKKKN